VARVAARVAFGEINDRSRVWRPSSSRRTPGQRAPGVARFIASIRKGLRQRPDRVGRPESAFLGRSRTGATSRAPFRPPRSRILSLTADRPLSGWAVTGVSLRRGVWSDPHRGAPPGTFRAANPFNTVNASRHPNANIASSPAAIAYDGRQHAWASAGRNGTHVIGDPFRQAEAAIHALVREIGQHQIFGTDPPSFAWSHCVAFPDCRYDPQGVPTKCSADLVIDGGKLLQLKDWVTTIMARRPAPATIRSCHVLAGLGSVLESSSRL